MNNKVPDPQKLLKHLNYSDDWFVQETEDCWELYARNMMGGQEVHPYKIIKAPKQCSQHAEYWPPPAESMLIAAAPALAKEVIRLRKHIEELEKAGDEVAKASKELSLYVSVARAEPGRKARQAWDTTKQHYIPPIKQEESVADKLQILQCEHIWQDTGYSNLYECAYCGIIQINVVN